jgi:hypothetical protein
MRFGLTSLVSVAALTSFALLTGCSEDAGDASSGTEQPGPTATFGAWSLLVDDDWTLEAGAEGYRCIVVEVPYDISVVGFRPIAPVGTHHTVLTRGVPASNPEERYDCDGNTNAPFMIYGSGVGTEPLTFPDGVAIDLKKGEKIMLNLHLFNVSPGALSGRSGIEVLAADPATIEESADVVLAGPINSLLVPPGESVNTGYCTAKEDATVFAVFPHMHQLGTHMKVTAVTAEGETVLLDNDYTFDDQRYTKLSPYMGLKKGEHIRVECTYENPTAIPRYWGDSTLDEMCLAGIYRYPRENSDNVVCSDRNPDEEKEGIDPAECDASVTGFSGEAAECLTCAKSRCCDQLEACDNFPACAEVSACRAEHTAACSGEATSFESFYSCVEEKCGVTFDVDGTQADKGVIACLMGSCRNECGL